MAYQQLSANSKKVKKFQLQQRFRAVYTLLIIGLPLVFGIAAYSSYKKNTSQINNLDQTTLDTVMPTANIPGQVPDANQIPPNNSTPGSSSVTNPINDPPPAAPSAAASNKIPNGVTVAINSIEANGIKNNPYVNIDTTNVPEGTVIKIDRKSWTQLNPEQISVNGTVTIYGQSRQGSLIFGKVNNSWKVINYTVYSQ